MSIINQKDLVLTYKKEDDSHYSLTVADYKDGITDAEVKTGAQAILTQDIFAPGGMDLTALVSAKRVDKTTTDVSLAD